MFVWVSLLALAATAASAEFLSVEPLTVNGTPVESEPHLSDFIVKEVKFDQIGQDRLFFDVVAFNPGSPGKGSLVVKSRAATVTATLFLNRNGSDTVRFNAREVDDLLDLSIGVFGKRSNSSPNCLMVGPGPFDDEVQIFVTTVLMNLGDSRGDCTIELSKPPTLAFTPSTLRLTFTAMATNREDDKLVRWASSVCTGGPHPITVRSSPCAPPPPSSVLFRRWVCESSANLICSGPRPSPTPIPVSSPIQERLKR